MNLTPIISRIDTQIAAFGGRVNGAAELEAALDNVEQLTSPHAFVVWVGDDKVDQNLVPGQQARFAETFEVVIAADNSVDVEGEAGVANIETLAPLLKTALIGWAPSASHLPVTYEGSVHAEMNQKVVLHSFSFATVIPGGSIFTYQIELRVKLASGATVATVFAAYETAIDGVLGANTRLTSDYLIDREVIPESATRYQLVEVPAGIDELSDFNTIFTELQVRLTVHHHLAPTDTERTYTETTMVAALASLLNPSFWRNSSIWEVAEPPTLELGADLSRE
jgi:hypothetical protein